MSLGRHFDAENAVFELNTLRLRYKTAVAGEILIWGCDKYILCYDLWVVSNKARFPAGFVFRVRFSL